MGDDHLLALVQLHAVHLLEVCHCSLSAEGATLLVNTSTLKRLVLRVHEDRVPNMRDALAVLRAASSLDFHCWC
jgi:hypothetical protein